MDPGFRRDDNRGLAAASVACSLDMGSSPRIGLSLAAFARGRLERLGLTPPRRQRTQPQRADRA